MTILTHNPSKIIQHILVDLGVASFASSNNPWPIFPDKEPDNPDTCITVYNTDPNLLGGSMLDPIQERRYGIQLRVRTTTKNGIKIREVSNALENGSRTISINDTESSSIQVDYLMNLALLNNGPLYLGTDSPQSGRHLYVSNFEIDLRQI